MKHPMMAALEWMKLCDKSPTPGMWGLASEWKPGDTTNFRALLDGILELRGVSTDGWEWNESVTMMGFVGYSDPKTESNVAGISLGSARMILPWQREQRRNTPEEAQRDRDTLKWLSR